MKILTLVCVGVVVISFLKKNIFLKVSSKYNFDDYVREILIREFKK